MSVPRRLARLPTRSLPDGRLAFVAASVRARLLGLAWLPPPGDAAVLELPGCRSVHTFGMRFALDLTWLDRDGRPLRVDLAVPPSRVRWCRRAASVLEAPARAGIGHASAFFGAEVLTQAPLSPEADYPFTGRVGPSNPARHP